MRYWADITLVIAAENYEHANDIAAIIAENLDSRVGVSVKEVEVEEGASDE